MRYLATILLSTLIFLPCGCSRSPSNTQNDPADLIGTIRVDGSSTVWPVTQIAVTKFESVRPNIVVTLNVSGTGGGFKRFCTGQTDINNASRTINEKEREVARENGIEFLELPLGFDGISIVVNPKNTFCDQLTVDELKQLWQSGSKIQTWQQLRPEWPDRKIRFLAPGRDSGTFDFFTEVICGKIGDCRQDIIKSEDDNILVEVIREDHDAIGFFGYAYFVRNSQTLKLVGVNSGTGSIIPTGKTIGDGSYVPLSRPLFLYANKSALQRRELLLFLSFYLEHAGTFVEQAGYFPFEPSKYMQILEDFHAGTGKGLGEK